MPSKVKRGIGLLAIAALGLLVAQFAMRGQTSDSNTVSLLANGLVFAAAAAFLGGLIGGLILIAWGLLRD